jgi:hypothetical protein
MANFDTPDGSPLVDASMMPTTPWRVLFSRWQTIILSVQQSGTTAQRPTSVLWIGRRFFDITIGQPVYLKSIAPRVWVNGAGTNV